MKLPLFKKNTYIKLWFVFIFGGFNLLANGQMLETRYDLSLSGGMGTINGAESNIFFPDFVKQRGTNYNLTCTRKIFNWMDAGISANYLKLSSINWGEGYVKEMTSYKGSITGAGTVLEFHLPYVRSGIWNRLIPKLQISPSVRFLESARVIKFDNIVVNEDFEEIDPMIKMPQADTGFGISITPGVKYRASQNMGIYLGMVYAISSFHTKYGQEQLNPVFLEMGLVFSFGRYKELFL